MNLNREYPTKEGIYKFITDLDIYNCYIPNTKIKVGTPILSPLRKEENASFGFFIGSGDEILFNDFVLGGGDCFKFIQLKYGYTFFEALSRVIIDFKLTDEFIYKELDVKPVSKIKSINKEEFLKKCNTSLIRKRSRKWNFKDMKFWTDFGISLQTLKNYNVEPLSHIFIDDKVIVCKDLTYCFIEYKDNEETYKIYQPFNKDFKWINNHNDSVWQGWSQLPENGDKVIITKSLKDVMTINSLTGIPATALQAESVRPKEHIIKELRNRFQAVWIWYDNDFDSETNWGRLYATQLEREFNLIRTEIPSKFKVKDPSDFCKKYGRDKTKNLIKNLTSLPF